jgi:putative heme-binding domain-containing protein
MRLPIAILFCASVLFAQHDPDMKAARYMGEPAAIAAGGALYQTACSGCHGPKGEGGRGSDLVNGRGVRRADDETLFERIQKGVPGTDMPGFPFPDEQVWQLTAFVRSLSAPAFDWKVPGDIEAGRAIFEGKGGCVNCHSIRGNGGHLGPDLSVIGHTRTVELLKESILEPSKRIPENYIPAEAVTNDGKRIKGSILNRNNYSLQMIDGKGELHLLPASEVREIVFQKGTWMPQNYGQRLSEDELQNVIAFLSRQAGHPSATSGERRRRGR